MRIIAATSFATYIDDDCVSVTCGQTVDVPQEQADSLVAGGLANFAAESTEPPESKPAGASPEVKVVEAPEVKATDAVEPPKETPAVPRQRSRK
jgi:hypothetical protein